ncbi:MAG: Crp/Fnr family transcriptional regulator [Usitatibacter sp.]
MNSNASSSIVACGVCAFNPICVPRGRGAEAPSPVEARRRVPRGQPLFSIGDPQSSIYALRAGFIKSVVHCGDQSHIVRFLLPGDVAGLDGCGSGFHASDAVALSDCELCEISTYRANMLCDFNPRVGTHMRRLIAQELAFSYRHAASVASLRVRERLGRFLVDLGQRWRERGYSARAYLLPMTRRDIAEHLGLTPETVSRVLAELQSRGWIRHRLRSVEILDEAALRGKVTA